MLQLVTRPRILCLLLFLLVVSVEMHFFVTADMHTDEKGEKWMNFGKCSLKRFFVFPDNIQERAKTSRKKMCKDGFCFGQNNDDVSNTLFLCFSLVQVAASVCRLPWERIGEGKSMRFFFRKLFFLVSSDATLLFVVVFVTDLHFTLFVSSSEKKDENKLKYVGPQTRWSHVDW